MDRGQIHTLEAFLAALLLVGALLFATQATAVTPLSASTSNQHIENQNGAVAADLLRLTAHDGSLKESLLYWNHEQGRFYGAPEDQLAYTGVPSGDHPLSDHLNTSFGTGELAYNIELTYQMSDGTLSSEYMFHMGTPSDHAVTASRMVTLYEHDNLTADGFEDQQLGNESTGFWAANVSSASSLYNVVEVRITVWRM